MKAKYDREGVEYVSDELELAERQAAAANEQAAQDLARKKGERAHTMRGSRKPGDTDSGSDLYNKPPGKNVNMGGAD